jgi:hypothetical protein
MDRKECEKRIAEKAREIEQIVKEYNPECKYVVVAIANGYIDIHNAYFGEDAERPIHAWVDEGGEINEF